MKRETKRERHQPHFQSRRPVWRSVLFGMALMLLIQCAVFELMPSAMADAVLSQIWVNLTPARIVVDGQEKIPADDMKPFAWNNRIYVSLGFVSQVFGKEAKWDQSAYTAYINSKPKPVLTSMEESFVESMSIMWRKEGNAMWRFDGPNGMNCGSFSSNLTGGILILEDFFPDSSCNFTVEFEAASYANNYGGDSLFRAYLGRNGDKLGDHLNSVSYGNGIVKFNGNDVSLFKPELNVFYPIKIIVKNGQMTLTINNTFITSERTTTEKAAFAFDPGWNYIRNFKITIDN